MTDVNTPVLDALVAMNEGVPERSGLDDETFMLVRIAALASTGASPEAYLLNLEVAAELGLTKRTVYRLITTWLLVDGVTVTSFMARLSVAVPMSLKTVGHGASGENRG